MSQGLSPCSVVLAPATHIRSIFLAGGGDCDGYHRFFDIVKSWQQKELGTTSPASTPTTTATSSSKAQPKKLDFGFQDPGPYTKKESQTECQP